MSEHQRLSNELQQSRIELVGLLEKQKLFLNKGANPEYLVRSIKIKGAKIDEISKRLKAIDSTKGTWTGGGGNYKASLKHLLPTKKTEAWANAKWSKSGNFIIKPTSKAK